jgi:hypothetical protein
VRISGVIENAADVGSVCDGIVSWVRQDDVGTL